MDERNTREIQRFYVCDKDKQQVPPKLHVKKRIAKNLKQKKENEYQAVKHRNINSVIKHGGPVKSSKDVQALVWKH